MGKEGEAVNVQHWRCSLTPTTADAAGRSQRVIGIGSKVINVLFISAIALPVVLSVIVGEQWRVLMIDIAILALSAKIIYLIHAQLRMNHFQFWILSSPERRINEITKQIRELKKTQHWSATCSQRRASPTQHVRPRPVRGVQMQCLLGDLRALLRRAVLAGLDRSLQPLNVPIELVEPLSAYKRIQSVLRPNVSVVSIPGARRDHLLCDVFRYQLALFPEHLPQVACSVLQHRNVTRQCIQTLLCRRSAVAL